MTLGISEIDAKMWTKQARKPELVVGVHESPWGWVMVGFVGKELAALNLVERGKSVGAAMDRFVAAWPGAPVRCDKKGTAAALKQAVAAWHGRGKKLNLLLKGTKFQRQVWRELVKIPSGATTTYGDIAKRMKNSGAVRAVGQAVGANPVGVLVPCHRVLAHGGKIGGYAWGLEKKRALLKAEGVSC
jgi:AraC family transcriptional regulator, regulatory protein of adaptative response / methylated-DNA-[protein]-cysteine methyltransferase